MTPSIENLAQYGILGTLLAIALLAIVYLYKSRETAIKEKDSKIDELNLWVRVHAQDSIVSFNNIANLIDKVMSVAERTQEGISDKLDTQANDIKSHISLEVEKLKTKVNGGK